MTGPYRFLAAALAVAVTALGIAILGVTASRGGGSTGYLIGVLFAALGCGRLYLLRR